MKTVLASLLVFTTPAMAQTLPACAKTGAVSVFFNGKPALKLADVAACPAGSYDIIPNIVIEGQPMVHFNTGIGGCVAAASPNVIVDGKAATTAGDVACPEK